MSCEFSQINQHALVLESQTPKNVIREGSEFWLKLLFSLNSKVLGLLITETENVTELLQ